jgi:hypothetical protein
LMLQDCGNDVKWALKLLNSYYRDPCYMPWMEYQLFSVTSHLIVRTHSDTKLDISIERLTLGTKLALNRHDK